MNAGERLRYYLEKHPEVRELAQRCLATERWGGNAVLMLLDAAFTSIGVNYFSLVVPRVEEFREKYLRELNSLKKLSLADEEMLSELWRNQRSWHVAKAIASYLAELGKEEDIDDAQALRHWAAGARLAGWREDHIGMIRGVGVNTFQYLRMMGGVDTVMPDKVVWRFTEYVLGERLTGEREVVERAIGLARSSNCYAVELCFLAWLAQYTDEVRMERYKKVLKGI